MGDTRPNESVTMQVHGVCSRCGRGEVSIYRSVTSTRDRTAEADWGAARAQGRSWSTVYRPTQCGPGTGEFLNSRTDSTALPHEQRRAIGVLNVARFAGFGHVFSDTAAGF